MSLKLNKYSRTCGSTCIKLANISQLDNASYGGGGGGGGGEMTIEKACHQECMEEHSVLFLVNYSLCLNERL